MTEKWTELPKGDTKYMISNLGRIVSKANYDNGEVELYAIRWPIKFQLKTKGVTETVRTVDMVRRLFGLPCDGTECTEICCEKCGFNPEIAKQRFKRMENGEMQMTEDGTKRLFIDPKTGI